MELGLRELIHYESRDTYNASHATVVSSRDTNASSDTSHGAERIVHAMIVSCVPRHVRSSNSCEYRELCGGLPFGGSALGALKTPCGKFPLHTAWGELQITRILRCVALYCTSCDASCTSRDSLQLVVKGNAKAAVPAFRTGCRQSNNRVVLWGGALRSRVAVRPGKGGDRDRRF